MVEKIFVCSLIIILVLSVFFVNNDRIDSLQIIDDYSIDNMNLDEKIGQMLFVEYRSNNYTDNFYKAFSEYQPGGFLLYSENFTDYRDYYELYNNLVDISDIPLFFGIDWEGGVVQRFICLEPYHFLNFPSLRSVGDLGELYSYNVGRVTGEELKALGINVNFSPVLDIFANKKDNKINYSRSFSSDISSVSILSRAYITGLQSTGMISCAKHLPGIGEGTEDTHFDTSYIYKSKNDLETKELVPFKYNEDILEMMMISHSVIPDITGDLPLTLSKNGIAYLRNYLDYDGLIVSDGLRMHSLTNHYTIEEILVYSINAGVNLLLSPEKMTVTVPLIKKNVLNGNISESTIDDSVRKILKLKKKLQLEAKSYSMNVVGSNYHQLLLKYRDFNIMNFYKYNFCRRYY